MIEIYYIVAAVTVYGEPRKGSGCGPFLKSQPSEGPAIAVFDSDLLSITPEWIRNILDPVIEGYDFVAPDYKRYKLDGTITNTIAYNLTRALYGKKIRQPIGGDFGVSPALIKFYLEQDVWETDVAKFGVDIWMTTSAIVGGFRICQAKLGAKIHGQKDPSADLGPMFRQVVGTTFQLMERYEDYWLKNRRSRDVPALGEFVGRRRRRLISLRKTIEYFKVGLQNFGTVWRNIIDEQDFEIVRKLGEVDSEDQFFLRIDTWVRTVYRYAGAFHATPRQRFKVLDTLAPLYYGRVASLGNELRDKSPAEAEAFRGSGRSLRAPEGLYGQNLETERRKMRWLISISTV